MAANVGGIDKTAYRCRAGLVGWRRWVVVRSLGLIGVVPLATGVMGWCPAYTLFRMNTCPMKKQSPQKKTRCGGFSLSRPGIGDPDVILDRNILGPPRRIDAERRKPVSSSVPLRGVLRSILRRCEKARRNDIAQLVRTLGPQVRQRFLESGG